MRLCRTQDVSLCVPHADRAALSRAIAVVAFNVTVAAGLDSKSLEALQKAVFEFSGGDAALKTDMSQYHMQLHVCGDSLMWGTDRLGSDAACLAASAGAANPSFSSSAAAASARSRAASVGSDDAVAVASTHVYHTAAAAAAVQQQLVLYALVLSMQTVKALRNDIEYVLWWCAHLCDCP